MSFEDNLFDTIVTINTIYFWKNLNAQQYELNRAFRKGGQLVIAYRPEKSMCNLPFAQDNFKHYDPIKLKINIEHLGFCSISEIKNISIIKSIDESVVEIEDICLIVEKIN